MDRKTKILIFLILILAASVAYRITHPFKQDRVESLTYTGIVKPAPTEPRQESGPVAAVPIQEDYDIFLNLFEHHPTYSGEVKKPLFSSARETKPVKKTSGPKGKSKAEPARPDSKKQAYKESVVDRELGAIKFFGYFADKEGMAIFLKRGKDILVVRQGDKIDGKYLVETLTVDTIILKAEHINDVVHINLNDFLSEFETAKLNLGK